MARFEDLRQEYSNLWASLEPLPSKEADIAASAAKLVAKKTRYRAVEKETGVPWYVVGLIHLMEAGGSFACHLHNGDSLAARTIRVPKGRPKDGAPPFTWKDSACDAMRYDGLDKVTDWTIERVCFELEKFNGMGYRDHHPEVLTPYLWSGTNHYARGKYVADGKWDASAISGQSGAMAIFHKAMEFDAELAPNKPEPAKLPSDPGFPRAEPNTSVVSTAAQSRTVWAQIVAAMSVVAGALTDTLQHGWDWLTTLVGIVPGVADDVRPTLNSAQEVAGWFHVNWASISLTIASVAIVVAIVRHIELKRKAIS